MTELFGFTLLYLIPALLVTPLWWLVRRLALTWETRNLMDDCRPTPWQIHHTERVTGIVKL